MKISEVISQRKEVSSYLTNLSWRKKLLVCEILKELERAENKHPNFPEDRVYAAAIVAEESVELVKAALQYGLEDGDYREIRKEAIQVAAASIRLILNF